MNQSANLPDHRPTWVGFLRRLLDDRAGNTLALVAAATLPILGMVGGSIDMGRSYLSQSRLQQACDAGVLAARKKLGSDVVVTGDVPDDVAETGNKFFNLNFRPGAYGTENRAFEMTLEQNYSISGVATVEVPTTVMKVFGFDDVPVQVECEARLNFSNTDVMMVLDTTGSMRETNPGDSQSRMVSMRQVVKSFYTQVEGSKGPGTRIRFGFVPYSTNINVGALLEDDWVVDEWTYQSRKQTGTLTHPYDNTYYANFDRKSGTYVDRVVSTYPATYHPASSETGSASYSCDTPAPANTYTDTYTLISTTTEPYVGPPAGTRTIQHYRREIRGSAFWVERSGTDCIIKERDHRSYIDEFDRITVPAEWTENVFTYRPYAYDVRGWRSWSNGCIEERATVEIADYDNVDLGDALDLDLDRVPVAGQPDTQWRPAKPDVIFERSMRWDGSGSFVDGDVVTSETFLAPNWAGLSACPSPARKLAEMTSGEVDSYLGSLRAEGSTYHDIGMIWGGRLISPTGLFADENADLISGPTSRNLIFLTDGKTEPLDLSYGTYGVEPLDKRRWSPSSSLSLSDTIERRFGVACDEVKKRNVTVWVIGFGTSLNPVMTECAGAGHFFEASDAAQLNDVFSRIAAAMGDLRVTK